MKIMNGNVKRLVIGILICVVGYLFTQGYSDIKSNKERITALEVDNRNIREFMNLIRDDIRTNRDANARDHDNIEKKIEANLSRIETVLKEVRR